MSTTPKPSTAVGDAYVAQRQREFQRRLLAQAAAFLRGCVPDTLHMARFGEQGQYTLKVQASGAVTVHDSQTGQPLAQDTLQGLTQP